MMTDPSITERGDSKSPDTAREARYGTSAPPVIPAGQPVLWSVLDDYVLIQNMQQVG